MLLSITTAWVHAARRLVIYYKGVIYKPFSYTWSCLPVCSYQYSEFIFTYLSESLINAKGILQEVWDTGEENDNADALKEYSVFRLQSIFWNLIQIMDAPTNIGNKYAQKLTAYLKVTSRLQ